MSGLVDGLIETGRPSIILTQPAGVRYYWIGLDLIGLDRIGLDWIGLDWIGLDWIGLDWIANTHNAVSRLPHPFIRLQH